MNALAIAATAAVAVFLFAPRAAIARARGRAGAITKPIQNAIQKRPKRPKRKANKPRNLEPVDGDETNPEAPSGGLDAWV